MLANELSYSAVFINESTLADTSSEQITLTRLEESVNRSTYGETISHTGGVVHSVPARNQVQFYRTYPKRSGTSRGAAKLTVKFTRDISVPNADGSGSIVLPLIVEVNFSIPVGASHAQISNLRRRAAKMLTLSAATSTEATAAIQYLTEGLQI